MKVTWQDKEVTNPVLRVAVIFGVSVYTVLMAIMLVLLVATVVVLIPLWVPLHCLLRRSGRKGFVWWENNRTYLVFKFGPESFRRL